MSELVLVALVLAALILVASRLRAVRATSRQYRWAVCAASFDTLDALRARWNHGCRSEV